MKKTVIITILAILALFIPVIAKAGCTVGDKCIAKRGSIAAVNADRLEEAKEFEKKRNEQSLQRLAKEGEVVIFAEQTVVEVVEDHAYRVEIKMKNGKTYWMDGEDLSQY